MITLYQFPTAFGLPNLSPFCMKVETYLRMAGLAYRCDNRGLLQKAPKGKLPFIDDDGSRIADSTFIIEYLQRKYGDPFDAPLAPRQRALGVVIRRLLEENLYWALIYLRWIDDAGFAAARQAFFAALPAPLRLIVPPLARRSVRQEIHGHGLGRHRPEEIMAIGCTDLTALAELLGEQAYFLGDAPTTLDASAYAFLANILVFPEDSPLARHARSLPALPAYCRRMRERYFSASPR